MKKIGLICATLLAGLSLAGCNNMASQSHKSSSNSSSATKVVKHHIAHKQNTKRKQIKKKHSFSASSTSIVNQSSQQQTTSSSQASSVTQQSNNASQPKTWQDQQPSRDQVNGTPISEDQARAMLGGANGDLQATRTSNGWTFSGDGYTATVGDNGNISHN